MLALALMFVSIQAADSVLASVWVLVEPSFGFDEVRNFKDGFAVVHKNYKYGYVDKTGKLAIPLQYDGACDFNEGFAAVWKGEKCGIIDTSGKTVIPFEYDILAECFHEGLAIAIDGEKMGYIDKTNKIVLPLEYYGASRFEGGFALVKNKDKRGIIDTSGKTVAPFEYTSVVHPGFDNGIAIVSKGNYPDEKYGAIDTSGKAVVPFDYAGVSIYDGMAVVTTGTNGKYKYGCIDIATGKTVVAAGEYDYIGLFGDGLAAVRKGDIYGGKCGYIDKTGKVAIPLEYMSAGDFSEGLAFVGKAVDGEGKYFYIDTAGKIAIDLGGYANGRTFRGGIALVERSDFQGIFSVYEYIDKEGNKVTPVRYPCAYDFSEGLAWINTGGVTTKSGYQSSTGKWGILKIFGTGDPIGDVLYSDITAYINGYPIPSSNIKGNTMIIAEDLANYGFDVKWNNNDRTLKIEWDKNKKFTPLPAEKDTVNKPGAFRCKYVYTDIKTYLSGVEVESYNINGRTFVSFDLLSRYGTVTWDGKAREIRIETKGQP